MRVVEVLRLIVWLSFALSVTCQDVSLEFTSFGYLVYRIEPSNEINSERDELSLNFKTVQPTGLLFHGRNSAGKSGDYITVELVGGRLRYSVRLGKYQSIDDTKEEFLGKDLNDGNSHSVLVSHGNTTTEIWLDRGTSAQEMKKIETVFEKLELDIAIYVGGAPSYKDLQGVKSNANFMGCLTVAKFTLKEKGQILDFLGTDVATAVGVNKSKRCPQQLYDPFTFSAKDLSFIFVVQEKDTMEGTFKFRTYMKGGTLLKQTNGNNGFTVTFGTSDVTLTVTVNNFDTTAFVTFTDVVVSNGNWHAVRFEISPSIVSLEVDNKKNQKPPGSSIRSDFFKAEVTAGGYIGCMRDLIINGNSNKPQGLEWQGCNITDFCVFAPCLHGGKCSQDGKSFECDCTGTMYLAPVCQFSEYVATCDILKRENPGLQSRNMTLDVDGPGPLEPFKAFCNMSATPATTEIISHSQKVQIKVHPPSAGKDPESVQRSINYYPSIAAAEALARNSKSCKQYIEYGCKKSKLLNVGEGRPFGRWVSSDGVYKNYWGGANPSSQMCACGEKNNCLGGKKCNCDARQDIWSSDAGVLSSERDLPVSQLVLGDLSPELGSAGNFTVGNLICSGEVSNTATFVNEDGMIKLDKPWTPPSDGVISLFFKTPYAKGVMLFNGDLNDEFFQLEIFNETSVELIYNIGNNVRRLVVSLADNQKVSDRAWHHVEIFRNLMHFGLRLDAKLSSHTLPLFKEKNLDLDASDPLVVGGYPWDVSKGFVGCIRGLTINGEVIDLYKKAEGKPYVRSGCGASCPTPKCLNGGRCVDDYNVYRCDCSLTPFYGYFCEKDYGATFKEGSQLTYTFETADTVPGVDFTIGFTFASKDACFGDLLKITSRSTDQFFLLSSNPTDKKLRLSFIAQGGDGFEDIALPGGLSYCDGERHIFAFSRVLDQVNYTVDNGEPVLWENPRLRFVFPEMYQIILGSGFDRGFTGCITGVKVTKRDFAQEYPTVEPIKEAVYEGKTERITAVGITRDSKAKCGMEEEVGPIPTPRYVGGQDGRPDATTLPGTPSPGRREDDNQTAIIVVVVLLLVLILVVLVLVIYWYWARHKGEYHTHEDDEMIKDSSPYINLADQKNQAGQEPEKKKEWYI